MTLELKFEKFYPPAMKRWKFRLVRWWKVCVCMCECECVCVCEWRILRRMDTHITMGCSGELTRQTSHVTYMKRWEFVRLWVWVCVCVWMYEWTQESVCVYVLTSEIQESVCVYVMTRERSRECVCVCVCEWESARHYTHNVKWLFELIFDTLYPPADTLYPPGLYWRISSLS